MLGGLASFAEWAGAGPKANPHKDVRAPVQSGPSEPTAWGFHPFPYDFTLEAIETTYEIVGEQGTLYPLHFDNGVPWAEALADSPWPQQMADDWDDIASRIPPGHKVYVGLAPTAKERHQLAPPIEGSSLPLQIQGAYFDHPQVKTAFLNYARRAVEKFQPDYLNLGIEVGEILNRSPSDWSRFVSLYRHVRDALKEDHPNLMIGVSFTLQVLMNEPGAADSARSILDHCDYLGLSFYPFGSPFNEAFGVPALPPPPGEWREPLEWVRQYTGLPIAICETGYSTVDVSMPAYGIYMNGSEELQSQYLADLGGFAGRDGYLFVMWFVPVDYDALYEQLPPGDGVNLIWKNIGLFDGSLQPKPALEIWQQLQLREPVFRLGFAGNEDLFEGPAHDRFRIQDSGGSRCMLWVYTYTPGRWQWCIRRLDRGTISGARSMSFRVRSNKPVQIMVQLTENSGESFFALVDITTTWTTQTLPLDEFQLSSDQGDGTLQADEVVQVLLADGSAAEGGASGRRKLWFADWTFE
jgi:hypothetical protein